MDQNTKDVLMITVPAVNGIALAIVAVFQRRAAHRSQRIEGNIERIETNTNANTKMLAAASQAQGHGEGVQQERTEQRAREAHGR